MIVVSPPTYLHDLPFPSTQYLPRLPDPVLLESIRIENGKLPLLDYHQERVDRSRRMYFAKAPAFRLDPLIKSLDLPRQGVHKLRLLYGAELHSVEVEPYSIRPVGSLQVVSADGLSYGRKYADRRGIQQLFDKRGKCDDIIMVQGGHLTDSSYANLALFDGRRWFTPAWPLLQGTRRAQLIQLKIIHPTVIRLRDIGHFESIRLINAMMEWEESPTVRCEAVLGS